MKKEFDFESIGKQTPYVTPDGFFEGMQQKVMERVGQSHFLEADCLHQTAGQQCPVPCELSSRVMNRKRRLKVLWIAAAVVVACVLIPSFFLNGEAVFSSNASLAEGEQVSEPVVSPWISALSDEELIELVSFSDNDIFLD